MMWNGKSWEMKSIDVHYKLNLGRDMADLLERAVIKKEDLTRTQMYIQMYKALMIMYSVRMTLRIKDFFLIMLPRSLGACRETVPY